MGTTETHAWQKLYAAVHALTGKAPQHDRMVAAVTALQELQAEHLPQELRERFTALMRNVTNPSVATRVYEMDQYDRREVIDEILWLYDKVCRFEGV